MLIQFRTKNFKCFKEEIKLSLIASSYDKSTRENENVFTIEKFGLRLLKSAVVYGANASGKTKLVEALGFMKNFISSSSKESQFNEPIGVDSFRLSSETENAPTFFEIIFIHEEEMFRYGFEVTKDKVHSEWLYHKPKTKEIELFYRDFQDFDLNSRRFKVSDLVNNDRIRPNSLLLSVAASWNDKIAKKIFDWLAQINIISGLNQSGFEAFSSTRIQQSKAHKTKVVNFMKNADLGIEDLNRKSYDDGSNEMPDSLREYLSEVMTVHKKFDGKNLFESLVEFSLEEDESAGTNKYFALSGPIMHTLENGSTLVVDELASKLHPNLTCSLIELFNSKELNPKNAQLIFNTHDTNLLGTGLFRRDQIWFTEKDRYGAATLFSLADFKSDKVRKEDNFEKNYLHGRYGAVPYLGGFPKL